MSEYKEFTAKERAAMAWGTVGLMVLVSLVLVVALIKQNTSGGAGPQPTSVSS